MGIQAAGVGGFPMDWPHYLRIRDWFDKTKFPGILFEQRTMVTIMDGGTELRISKVVLHVREPINYLNTNFRTDWVARGNVIIDGAPIEVELPSYQGLHLRPFWFDSKSDSPPILEPQFLSGC